MRACAGMSKKGTDFICRFRRKDMFELAGLLLDFRFAVHGQAVGKKALSQAVAADDTAGPFPTARRELHNHGPIPG